jgi:hypothetical protein
LSFSYFPNARRQEKTDITGQQFSTLLNQVSRGWNEGNARMAADVFATDAVYEEPPKKQFYKGRHAIFEFFGGEKGFDRPMKMTWHNIAFNEDTQVGFGEYTFSMNNQYHGIVAIKIENRKITSWREYQYQSADDWKTFAGESEFETVP